MSIHSGKAPASWLILVATTAARWHGLGFRKGISSVVTDNWDDFNAIERYSKSEDSENLDFLSTLNEPT